MRSPLRTAAAFAATLILAGLVIQACQDQTTMVPFEPELAAAVRRSLKLSGGGTGNGSVTARRSAARRRSTAPSPEGPRSGRLYPLYANNTTVRLTATAATGSKFKEWRNACTGSNPTCTVRMSAGKAVRAVFQRTAATSFRLNVTGSGDGTATSPARRGFLRPSPAS